MLSGIIVFFLKFETNPKITLASTPPIINIEHVTDATGNVYNIPKTFTCGVNPLINQVSVNGSGSGTTPPGQIDQYQVQVDWGDGIQNNGIGVFTPSTGNGPFTFTFSAGIHTYGAPGAYTVKARIYHQGLPGNDSTADSVSTIQICFDVNDPPVISNVPASASIPELSAYTHCMETPLTELKWAHQPVQVLIHPQEYSHGRRQKHRALEYTLLMCAQRTAL